ncbi:amylo-alpha-1,6-glucosidase [Thioalkalivibrio paradoxus]|uniref:Glycogen-debranching protein n=1 Tax=Thioalkalivibrio paradoxus ARh 1 TaxID=713585 RepID=W0DFM6_9GAMM|nr:amylo-alpha-1,6-glucosidase [Thioalkalivibrio paradoxus]AHE97454.1 glycogen-debranching protein [Thioalkalivibrio paradoxus ARh 1]
MPIRFGREVTGDLGTAESREWLVTNGTGGYASGTVAGSLTRSYHGLLVAAVRPPVDRRLMLVKFDETVTYRGGTHALSSNRWASGDIAPHGYRNIQSFDLEGSVPRWCFACADALIEKRVWMEHGANTTYVAYTVVAAVEPVRLSTAAIVDNRVFHNTGQVAWPVSVEVLGDRVCVVSGGPDALALTLATNSGAISAACEMYHDFALPAEALRGLRDCDDHVHAATFEASIAPGETLVLLASAEESPTLDTGALERRRERDRMLLQRWRNARAGGAGEPEPWVEQLVLAADQFVVDRPSPGRPNGKSVIAGYHWFGDWGRDTMISLPGLTLAAGRPEIAAPILETFAQFVSDGMLPNRFPDAGEQPEYNTVDATLWYFEAVRAYHEATGDDALLRRLLPTLRDIVDWHLKGTRYGIRVDPADGLLRWQHDGVQLTWMDAKVGDHVITPRSGKPVEVNALWYNALCAMADFAERLGEDGAAYRERARVALAGFDRFWNPDTGHCFDVLDGPDGHEACLRPNQILAVALHASPLPPERQGLVLDACARTLLTSHGLRSLAVSETAYQGIYQGDQFHRDGAYHQGTVWAWLIGPFVDAHLRVRKDPAAARRLLQPFGDHLSSAGLGTISEIFDGDAPFEPRGCIAQAWSVGEVLRALVRIERFETAHDPVSQPPPKVDA